MRCSVSPGPTSCFLWQGVAVKAQDLSWCWFVHDEHFSGWQRDIAAVCTCSWEEQREGSPLGFGEFKANLPVFLDKVRGRGT